MRLNYIPLFSVMWVSGFAIWILVNWDYLINTQSGRTMLFFLGLMVALGLAVFAWSFSKTYGAKLMARINPSGRCPNCYAKLKDDTGFCPKCGKIVDTAANPNVCRCRRCGAEIDDPDRDFCPKCGSTLKK